MPGSRRDPAELAALVEKRVAQGMDLVDSFLAATGRGPRRPNRELALEHRRAVARQQREQSRFRQKRSSLRTQSVGGAVAAGALGSFGVIDIVANVAGADAPGSPAFWFLGAAVGLLVSVRGTRRLRRLPPAPEPLELVGPPPVLRRGAVGAVEVARFASVRVQIMSMAPSIDRLHPGAGADLTRADAEAAGPLTALCERLQILDELQRELPGTAAANTALTSAAVVRERIADGCSTYDALLSAAAQLMAAPDLSRSTTDVLTPAVDAMLAYAHGLQRASDI